MTVSFLPSTSLLLLRLSIEPKVRTLPELPEVETVCRGLAKALQNAVILRAQTHRADLRAPLPKNLGQKINGRKILSVTRRAKYILMALDGGLTLLLHLGMSGRMVLSPDNLPLEKHDHISFAFDNGLYARFNDPRRFGLCDLVRDDKLAEHPLLAKLGIEPLSPAFTAARLGELLAGRKSPIKTTILDQRLVVGVGNIYASESLYRAGISPLRPAGSCSKKEIAALRDAIVSVLNEAIAAGGSSLRDYVQADGELGYFQHNFAVYDHEGQPCPGCTCKAKIQRLTQAGRSTFYCPKRQK